MRTLPFTLFTVLISLSLITLTACEPKLPPIQASDNVIKHPTIQYQIPPRQTLNTVEWDFPRTTKQVAILNNAKCRKVVKGMNLDPNGIFDNDNEQLSHLEDYCKIPAIDSGSNLYIGLTEANYRALVNNYNVLMIREQRWIDLLNQINIQFKLQNKGTL